RADLPRGDTADEIRRRFPCRVAQVPAAAGHDEIVERVGQAAYVPRRNGRGAGTALFQRRTGFQRPDRQRSADLPLTLTPKRRRPGFSGPAPYTPTDLPDNRRLCMCATAS